MAKLDRVIAVKGLRARAALVIAAVALPLLAGPALAGSAPTTTASRTVSASYSGSGGLLVPSRAPVLVEPGPTQRAKGLEDRAKVSAADGSGRPVAIDVQWQERGSGANRETISCGKSATLSIARGSTVTVTPIAGACPDGTVSVPTSGVITVVFIRPLPVPIKPADRWAVLVGIQEYAGNTHPTFGARGDVAAIRTALLRSGWRSDHILTLLDGQASGQAMINAMSWLAARSGPRTFSLFHFSGHVCVASRGPCAPGHSYLWSQDNRFIPDSTVGSVLGQVQGHAWFDFAGCESGAFDAGLSSPQRLVSASSQASETSYEDPSWRQSVWSGLVWDRAFLQGHSGPGPGRATIGQMVAYGKEQAPRVTAHQDAGPQHPYVAGGDPTQSLYAPHL